jgi:anti-sigma factor RsiW
MWAAVRAIRARCLRHRQPDPESLMEQLPAVYRECAAAGGRGPCPRNCHCDGVPIGTVMSRLARARPHLRNLWLRGERREARERQSRRRIAVGAARRRAGTVRAAARELPCAGCDAVPLSWRSYAPCRRRSALICCIIALRRGWRRVLARLWNAGASCVRAATAARPGSAGRPSAWPAPTGRRIGRCGADCSGAGRTTGRSGRCDAGRDRRHIRSMQADHLTDVPTSDQHGRPWLSARLDVSPPVRDLSMRVSSGRRLADYVDGHQAAVVVYRHAKHVINCSPGHAPGKADEPLHASRGRVQHGDPATRRHHLLYGVNGRGGRPVVGFATKVTGRLTHYKH